MKEISSIANAIRTTGRIILEHREEAVERNTDMMLDTSFDTGLGSSSIKYSLITASDAAPIIMIITLHRDFLLRHTD